MENLIYKQMIEESPIAYFSGSIIKDENGKSRGLQIKTCNKSFENLFNIKSVNIIGKDIADILPINQINRYLIYLDELSLNKNFSKDIYIKEINLNCKADIYIEDNNIYARIIKISNSSLKLSESFKRAPFIAWIKDIDGRYLDVNEIFLEVENVSYQDIIGKNDYSYMKKERADKYQLQDIEVLKDNKIHTYYVGENTDKIRHYEITKWPHIDEKTDTILGIIGIAIEKTNEIILRKELEKSQSYFSQIVENIEDVITIKDEERYHYISPAFEKIHGFNPEEANLYEDILGWKKNYNDLEYDITLEKDPLKGTSSRLMKIKSHGNERWLLSKIFPLKKENCNSNLNIAITRDVTNLKKMEDEFLELRMDYFANLSHELRTPINLILSSLQVLDLKMDKIDLEYFDYFAKYLGIVRQNGYRLLRLANNLIDITKIDSGNFSHNPKNEDIVNYVEDICMSVSEFVNSNELNLVFDTNVEEKIISFDPDNIERIILNLLSNAIKFTNKGGTIEVIIDCKDNVKIKVKDSGVGIPKDKLDSIFGRFEQLNSKTKNDKEGSGIGLSIVKSLAKMHNGDISVKSKLGEGSEFIVTLPDVLSKENTSDTVTVKETARNITNLNIEFSDIYT